LAQIILTLSFVSYAICCLVKGSVVNYGQNSEYTKQGFRAQWQKLKFWVLG